MRLVWGKNGSNAGLIGNFVYNIQVTVLLKFPQIFGLLGEFGLFLGAKWTMSRFNQTH
jgi:hypothetical protein